MKLRPYSLEDWFRQVYPQLGTSEMLSKIEEYRAYRQRIEAHNQKETK